MPRVFDGVSFAAATCLIATLLAGCSLERTRTAGEPAADTLANGLPRALTPMLDPWLAGWRRELPTLELDTFAPVGERAYAPYVAGLGAGSPANDVRTRAGIFVLAPDSARALDVDRYMDFEVGPDGRIHVLHEPDSTPLLFDFERDTVWHVAFCGTSCAYEHACWLDSLRFALAGCTETDLEPGSTWQAFVDVYDLHTRGCRRWASPPISSEAFGRHVELADSLLGERLRAGGSSPARAARQRGECPRRSEAEIFPGSGFVHGWRSPTISLVARLLAGRP